jgi:REP element-mobilizing transposase RayT
LQHHASHRSFPIRSPYTQLYIHLVWATWDRLPLLTPEVRSVVYQSLEAECEALGAALFAAGGTDDHVHLLVRIPTTVSVAALVKQLKGASSRLAGMATGETFRWQGGYGAFSISKSLLPRMQAYIENQEQHHREGTVYAAVEPPARGDGERSSGTSGE